MASPHFCGVVILLLSGTALMSGARIAPPKEHLMPVNRSRAASLHVVTLVSVVVALGVEVVVVRDTP